MRILRATYGSGDCAADVTERVQDMVKNGHLFLRASNELFGDPCPGTVKELRIVYELPNSAQIFFHRTPENRAIAAPQAGSEPTGFEIAQALEAAGMAVRLNLGCHRWPINGWVNIDSDKDFANELLADVLSLPFANDSVDEIYAGHILEHTALHENALAEWHRVLKPGGLITVTVPDMEKGLVQYRQAQIDLEWLNVMAFGERDRVEQNHHQVFTADILISLMRPYFPDAILIDDFAHLPARVEWQSIAQGHKP